MLVKGTAIRATLAAIEEIYGREGLARVRAALPQHEALLGGLVLASSNYPVEFARDVQGAIREVLGGGRVQANRKVGAAAGRADFGTVYRVFLRASSYELMLRSLDRAFRQYNSQGHVHWDDLGTGYAVGRILGVEGYSEAMWHAIAGRLEALLLLGGAKQATALVVSFSETELQLRLRWQP